MERYPLKYWMELLLKKDLVLPDYQRVFLDRGFKTGNPVGIEKREKVCLTGSEMSFVL